MIRRNYLAASGLLTVGIAGCTRVRGETQLTADDVVADDSSATLPFETDGEDVLSIQLQKQFLDGEKREYYPFYVSSWQRDGVRLDSLRLEFRSPPYTSGFSPAGISLQADAHAHKATLSRDEDDPSTTILNVLETTDIGHGSVVVQLLLSADHTQDPQKLWIGAEATLSSDSLLGADYRATGDVTVEFP
ncbi:hypothetical protein [Natrinema hispanicum]|uniref:DUF8121 domain-containing protein n=1 Tax=Natrinema hispanicum TaxID=392421 RepID=A0A1G6L8K4_9EURY|nr:hypothetical protein [Natrinema hispanicum]SDC39417.1 hypothetical protein SAMN05192552_1003228 [Natrinema hispanicum]SET00867.1 hypothetical protein SAMN04488694_10379 [Natrinema hispanicum]